MEATMNITPRMEPTTEDGWDKLDAEKSKSMPIIYLFFMILGPCIGTSLYTNVLQNRQQHYITRFAHEVDRVESQNAVSYDQIVSGMRYLGKSETEAVSMAAMSAKGRLQVQATLAAVKEMSGWTFYGCMISMLFVLVYPYRKRELSA